MNHLLATLQPYPFERLKQLFASVTPNPAYRHISLGIGEPRHATPQLVLGEGKATLLAHVIGMHWMRPVRPEATSGSTGPDDLIFNRPPLGHGSFTSCLTRPDFFAVGRVIVSSFELESASLRTSLPEAAPCDNPGQRRR